MSMNVPDSGNNRTTGSKMRNLLGDGNNATNHTPPAPTPIPATPPPPAATTVKKKRSFLEQFWLPLVLVAVLVIGVGLITFSVGVSRGRDQANAQRDTFYIDRYKSWAAEATVKATNPSTPSDSITGTSPNSFVFSAGILGRVDKIEGDKVTVLVLDKNGAPTGTSLVATLVPTTKVWRSVPEQTAEMRPGDSVLLAGTRTESGNYEARSILVLPPNS